MRLTTAQIDTIKSTAKAVPGEGAQVTQSVLPLGAADGRLWSMDIQ